jgi:deoxyadenosine/deoxycytidine kinase
LTTNPRYIAIEGCIGVGKTTLTRILAERFSARTVCEVVEENPFLPEFYQNPKVHAFKTQIFFLLSRYKQQETLAQGELFSSTTVADYTFAKDRIFAELTLSDAELALYTEMYNVLNTRVPKPDLVLFLQAPLDVILARIRNRGRSFERDIDADYLRSLIGSYQRFFAQYDETPLLIVDTADLNFPTCAQDVELIVDAMFSCKHGVHRLDARGLKNRESQLNLVDARQS